MNIPADATLVTSLSPEDRLALLRANDPLRTWNSVNDVRTCICCGRKLTGRRLQIWQVGDEHIFTCPTTGCGGSLPDFVMPGDPFNDASVWEDWSRTIAFSSAPS